MSDVSVIRLIAALPGRTVLQLGTASALDGAARRDPTRDDLQWGAQVF